MTRPFALAGLFFASLGLVTQADDGPQLFKRLQISDQFYSEGASYGDINKDGKVDIVAGPFWYEAPDFTKKHQFFEDAATKSFDPRAYSENFLQFVADFNNDGWPDILVIGFPGKDTSWYENPKGKDQPWVKHLALDVTDNESPGFGDLLGDGHPVLICMSRGQMGYAKPDPANPDKPWTFHPTSPKIPTYQRFTHGIGFGDVNGDGKMDLLDKDGWYEQPASLDGDPHWKRHAFPFAAPGGAQMYVFDVNGDGLPDVITSLAAHAYGLAWYEQQKEKDAGGEIKFTQHLITGDKPEKSPYGVAFSQIHAIAIADMDGDGLPDIVTGKRWWAHAPKPDGTGGDIGVNDPAVLYVFRLVRGPNGKADFVPYLIDNNSGVGTQVTVGKVSGGALPDIVVGNKKGVFLFTNQIDKLGKDALERAAPKPSSASAK
jgi:hypothetical protein